MLTKQKLLNLSTLALLAVTSFACTRTPTENDQGIAYVIQTNIGKETIWNQSCYQDESISQAIQTLLRHELTVDGAIQIALLNNPHIQEIYEDVGIAQADLIEAGLFSNPVFDIIFRCPYQKNLKTNIEYNISTSFIDLFLIPLRIKTAKAELEQTATKVTKEILDLAFTVEQTFYELQTAQKNITYINSIAKLTSLHSELVTRQSQVGNVNQLDLQLMRSRYLDAYLELGTIENEIIRLTEKMNRLLGFCENTTWQISPQSNEIEPYNISLPCLEEIALQERLELKTARYDVLRLSYLLNEKPWWVYTKGQIGVGGERDTDGTNVFGPLISGDIPLFNYGQANRMRLRAQLRKAYDHMNTVEIQVKSEVREAYALLNNNIKRIKDYERSVLPMQKKIMGLSEELYNVMGLGIDQLIENKRQEYKANSNYVTSTGTYWLARLQLDRALGGKLRFLLSKQKDNNNCAFPQPESSYEN